MATFKLPLSGNVIQSFSPFTGGQFGLVNIDVGESSDPDVEKDVLTKVAGYGKQLGEINDALIVLLKHFHPAEPLSDKEKAAIESFRELADSIADIKERHGRPALRR